MERNCGECTACCKTHGVLEILKMSGKWCIYCNVGQGCGIYAKRPRECRVFKCAWLFGIDGSGPQHRPDKINIVPEYRKISGIGMAMWFWELEEGALRSDLTRKWSRRNLLLGNCVMHVSLDAGHKLYLPERIGDLDRSYVFGSPEEEIEIVPFPESVSCFA